MFNVLVLHKHDVPVPKGREVRVNEKCFPAAPGARPQGTEKYSDKSGLISEQKS